MKLLLQSVKMTLLMMVFTGIIFPLTITLIANVLFPTKAQGSMVFDKQGQIRGSSLIAQGFSEAKYFHPRPSAVNYDASNSAGTNLGPTSKKLFEGIADDPSTEDTDESFNGITHLAAAYREENKIDISIAIPIDAVTRSASGLDPHISSQNALMQAKRVAEARKLPLATINTFITQRTEGKFLGIFGEEIVNVLELNLSLDKNLP